MRTKLGTRPANRLSDVFYAWSDLHRLTRAWVVALVALCALSVIAAMLANLGIPTGPSHGLITYTPQQLLDYALANPGQALLIVSWFLSVIITVPLFLADFARRIFTSSY